MKEGNQKIAIAGAILTVAVAIGLSVWYAGSLEADDEEERTPLEHFQAAEAEQISNPDENGNMDLDDEEEMESNQMNSYHSQMPQRH